MIDLTTIIKKFDAISLDEMDRVKLMDRSDTKFITHVSKLEKILNEASVYYKVLEIDSKRVFDYRTIYYDTPDHKMFIAHQNGKLNRYKIRTREYLATGIKYMEIKFKSNKGKTIKTRIKKKKDEDNFQRRSRKFVEANSPFKYDEIEKKMTTQFSRITLVHRSDMERITLDSCLSFSDVQNNERKVPFLGIIEVKQSRASTSSDFISLLRKHKIREMRFSKYCIGSTLVIDNLKYNRFKPKLLSLNKLEKYDAVHSLSAVS